MTLDRFPLNRPMVMAGVTALWALIMGLALQFFVLPVLFPHLHAGDGLLRGGDWVSFHRIAMDLASSIQSQGWGVWELRPEGQAPSGVAAALYALTGVYAPWVMLPVNTALFGLAVSQLLILLKRVTSSPWAWVGVLPLVLFPSSLQIYGQLHKDIFSIAGIFLLFNAMLDVLRPLAAPPVAALALRTLLGAGLVWTVRPYLVDIVLLAFWCGLAVWVIVTLVQRHQINLLHRLAMAALAAGLQFAFVQQVEQVKQVEQVVSACTHGPVWDRLACRLGEHRANFIAGYPDAASTIDADIKIKTFTDFLSYTPRALSIGFGAPFPTDWFSKGHMPGAPIMRLLSGVEMAFAYAAFLGLVFVAARHRVNLPAVWAALAAATVIVLIYTVAVPNVGTLYRMRLAPWHVCLGLGCVLLATVWLGRARTKES